MLTHDRKGKILVVDDTPMIIKMMKTTLEDEGYEAIVATTGEKALKRALLTMPDLILLDVCMPGMDGFETCRRLKASEKTKKIPVIFMTALTAPEDKVTGFEVGGVDYVTKPIEIEEVLARVGTHLSLKKMQQELHTHNQRLQQEVSERKQAEEAIRALNAELEQSLHALKHTQARLVQSEKMAALGGLVAGFAHELNTPVGNGITMASYLHDETEEIHQRYMQDKMKRSDLEHYLNIAVKFSGTILSDLQRISCLIQYFKQVAIDQSDLGRRRFLVKAYIENTLYSLRAELAHTKHVIKVSGDDTLSIESYPEALSQVVTGLVMNSVTHAYQGGEPGTLHFELMQEQDHLIVRYTDDGCGIPAEHLSRIFDPFFTTNRGSGRTGLGLHIVYNLVTHKLKGNIHCESQVGVGTTFLLNLPLALPDTT